MMLKTCTGLVLLLLCGTATNLFGQSDYQLEEGEMLEKTVDGQWVYKTLVASESFTFQFPADYQPYNTYFKEAMAPLLIYNNPDFDKSQYDPYENKWQVADDSHMLIQVYDLNEGDLDYIYQDFDGKMKGMEIEGVRVETFMDDQTAAAPYQMRSYFLTFEDIYYWRIDVVGKTTEQVDLLAESFITDFVVLNNNN